jgi:arylsulfatase A-like enzyme
LVLFTSDNGPWLSYGAHAGSAGALREGKGTCWEGGIRVPFLARWPGVIPPGLKNDEPVMSIDILPTIAKLTGAELPPKPIDGLDIWPLLSGEPGAQTPHDALFFYYLTDQLQAMRSGKWKLILPHQYRAFAGKTGRSDGFPVSYDPVDTGLQLFDLSVDAGETTDVAVDHPEIVKDLLRKVDAMRGDLGDGLTKVTGRGRRPSGTAEAFPPR